jgi:aminoglycoside 6'-N-acetyltransferase I
MRIRAANKSDLEEWLGMRTELWPESSGAHSIEIAEYFAGKSIDIVETFVAENERGELAGFIELNIRNFAEGSRSPKFPYVEAWLVRSKFQGLGYGRALMEKAESWAIENGFSELASDTVLNNENGIAMHKHLGFVETERIVCFIKKLE